MCPQPRILKPATYRRYYNKDGFHYIYRYHKLVASWLQRQITGNAEGKRELVLKRVAPAVQSNVAPSREEAPV
jgi:hypothetical protein